jgi:hypothetical protein
MPAITVCPALASVIAVSLPKPVLVPVMKIVFDIIVSFVVNDGSKLTQNRPLVH